MVGVENVVSGFKLKAREFLAKEAREELKVSQSHQKAWANAREDMLEF